jgi:hypothetical protein
MKGSDGIQHRGHRDVFPWCAGGFTGTFRVDDDDVDDDVDDDEDEFEDGDGDEEDDEDDDEEVPETWQVRPGTESRTTIRVRS